MQFDEVFEDKTKYGTKIKTDEYQAQGKNIIVDQGQALIAGYTDRQDGIFADVPAIVFGDHTRVVKYIDKPFFLGADGVKVLKSRLPDANYRYLYYALLHAKIPNTGYNRHFKWLKELDINYPRPNVQIKTAAVLDRVNTVISLCQQQLSKLDELVKARFVEMFGDVYKSTLYPYAKIGSFTSVMSGGTPDRKTPEYWQNGTIRWIKTTELQNNVITDTAEKITCLGMSNSSAKPIPANTVLIAMYGQGKTRGMTGYTAVECTTNQACACILPSNTVNQMYLWQYMILSYETLRELAKGGNQPNLNIEIIKSFPVLIPPLELQNQFAAFVVQVNKTKAAVQSALEKAQLLFDSLMQKYFG